ncbi:MAG: hypothetical protein KDA17_03885 [Candidatus Saccharibacteria bacterium]|nr:hypothetical protein [Candidatus Saccharibacteria bacterium]
MSVGSFVDGAIKGYQFVDEEIREGVRDQQRADLIAERKEDRIARREHQDKVFNAGEQHRAAIREKQDKIAGIQQQQHDWEAEDRRKARLMERDKVAFINLHNKGTPYPKELYEDMKSEGIGDLSVYNMIENKDAHNAARAAGRILESLKSGNVDAVNSPDSLEIINGVYSSQVRKGIGEFNGVLGGTIVDKRIVELAASPKKGAFVAEVEVTLDNGKKYTSPITMSRSSSPSDPVRLVDAGVAMDDLFARYQRANIAELNRDKIEKSYNAVHGITAKNERSATGKTIADLLGFGLSKDEAIRLATQSKTNPEDAAIKLAGKIVEAGMADDIQSAYEEAKRVLSGGEAGGSGQGGAPKEAEDYLKKHPELADQFKAKYGYLPEGFGSK